MADFATLIPVRRKPTRATLAFEKVTDVPYTEVKVELEEYAAILFRLSNGAPGSFTTTQAAIGRKSDTEFQVYGSTCSYAWNHKRSNELWIGRRDKPNEILIEGPALQDPSDSRLHIAAKWSPHGLPRRGAQSLPRFLRRGEIGGARRSRTGFPVPPSGRGRRRCGFSRPSSPRAGAAGGFPSADRLNWAADSGYVVAGQ